MTNKQQVWKEPNAAKLAWRILGSYHQMLFSPDRPKDFDPADYHPAAAWTAAKTTGIPDTRLALALAEMAFQLAYRVSDQETIEAAVAEFDNEFKSQVDINEFEEEETDEQDDYFEGRDKEFLHGEYDS